MKWLVLLVLFGCAQVTSLNMRKHSFGVLPSKILWYQIAGLEEEQIAMLRFQADGERKTAFEESMCVGKTWSYNLYDLRSKAEASFLSQMTGKKNIKLNCEDAELRPVWSYISTNGYNTGIFEIGASESQSLVTLNKCGEKGLVFLSSLYYFLRQEPVPGSKTFHYSENVPMEANQLLYDRSCDKKGCYSSINEDVKAIYGKFKSVSHKNMLIIRDFSFLTAIEKKDFIKAREILADLERSISESMNLTKQSSDYLVLVTSGDSRFVDMPDAGKNWYEFEKNGSGALAKRSKLTNLVFATGSRAENFCGMYDDSDVFARLLSGPKQQGLELQLINPFK